MGGFDHDVFISYAHLDNTPFGGVEENWIDCLHQRLKDRLSQLLGRPARIWRDPKLSGNEIFNGTISSALEESAVMLAVLSPRYIASSSCTKEVEHFRHFAESRGQLSVADKHRVLQVVKTEVPLEKRLFTGLLGYEFYADDGSGRMREFGYEQGPGKDRRYWSKLEDLALDIERTLRTFADAAEPTNRAPSVAGAAGEPEAEGKVLYLAETTSDLANERDSLRREFEQHGYRILPRESLPRDRTAQELAALVSGYLRDARLSVHLFGGRQGFIPEGGAEPIVRLQHEVARKAYAGVGIKRIVWIPKGLEDATTTEDGQRRFLKEFLSNAGALADAELLRDTIEDLKTYVHHVLKPPPEPVRKIELAPESLGIVYLLCDKSDYEETDPLEGFLSEQRCEVLPPLFEADEATASQYHQESLRLCDALLVYCSRAGEGWLKMKQLEMLKVQGFGRAKPLCAKAFVINGTANPYKDRFRSAQAFVIRHYGGFSPEALVPFVAAIKAAKVGMP